METTWVIIDGYENYEVSNTGEVRNATTHRILKGGVSRDGYAVVGLFDGSKSKYFTVHRLVAQMFLPNWDAKLEVNHIDGDKLNNHLNNLEMVTHLENMNHFWTSPVFDDARKSYRNRSRVMMKQRCEDPDFRDKIHSIFSSPEFRNAKSQRQKEIWNTDEKREFASKRSKDMWSDPDKHAKRIEAIKRGWSDEEKRKVVSDRMARLVWITPPEGKSIRVDIDEVDTFLAKGYTRGRKPLVRKNQVYCKETDTTYISMAECDKHFGWESGTTYRLLHDSLPGKYKHLASQYHISIVNTNK